MEEMRTHLQLTKIQAQVSRQSEHNLTSGGTRPAGEGDNSKFKAASSKRAGSSAMWIIETQGSASGEDAEKADTRYDVSIEIQNVLL